MSSIADFDDADFQEIAPSRPSTAPKADLAVSIVRLGKNKIPRVQFNFAPGVLEEIAGPRFDIAWAPDHRAFRITARDLGKFEPMNSTRGNRVLLRCPTPDVGFFATDEAIEPEFYVNQEKRAILIEIGTEAFRAPAASSVKPASPPATSGPTTHKAAVERARQAYPATSITSLRK